MLNKVAAIVAKSKSQFYFNFVQRLMQLAPLPNNLGISSNTSNTRQSTFTRILVHELLMSLRSNVIQRSREIIRKLRRVTAP